MGASPCPNSNIFACRYFSQELERCVERPFQIGSAFLKWVSRNDENIIKCMILTNDFGTETI